MNLERVYLRADSLDQLCVGHNSRIFTMRILKALARVPLVLSLALLLSGLVIPCQAQKRVIVITAGQPNVWTLEQAHSLLEQMNLRNGLLGMKNLRDLNPNQMNQLRFEVMSMLIELGATFNQADLTTKGLFENYGFNKSPFDEAFKDAVRRQIEKFNNAPTLNGSRRLDNYLQMQYEMIAKQLTLLRDEAGPGERVLFLEMPLTLNVAHRKSNKKWAQSLWKIAGYTRRENNAAPTTTSPSAATRDDLSKDVILSNELVRTADLIPSGRNVSNKNVRSGEVNSVMSTLFGSSSQQLDRLSQFVQLDLHAFGFVKGSHEFGWTFTPMRGMNRLQSGIRTTYAVVVVPDDAVSLVLEANGCYFPRSARHPTSFEDTKTRAWNNNSRTSRNCGSKQTKTFIVQIPRNL